VTHLTTNDFDERGEHLASLAAETSPDPLLLVERDGTIAYANAAARVLFGSPLRGDDVATIVSLDGPSLCQLLGNTGMSRAATARAGTGEYEEVDLTIGADADGTSAVTIRRRTDVGVSTIELLRRATHDDLTQLANRSSFVERVASDTHAGDRMGHALVMIDLDGFKQVNDGFGHDVGDQVLVEVARRLRLSCRPGDVVARLGGDEFALWCPGIRDEVAAVAVANRLLEAIEEPIPISASVTSVSASIGIVMTTDSLLETGELLAKADAAMYRAKGLGPGRFVVYDDALGRDLVRLRALERTLSDAIRDDQLVLHYQVLVDLLTGDPVGAEALVRWQHPRLGLLLPSEFVPVASRTQLLARLGNWVLGAAIGELARWNRVLAEPLTVSVNVATSQLGPDFVDLVANHLATHELEPRLLTIEVSEEIVSGRPDDGAQYLAELHELGVRIAIDDFGTGWSSLLSLQELPVDILKIDRAFVNGVALSKRQAAIVESVANLGHALDLQVVAEGIENAEDREAARELGCDLAQGFHFAKPAPADSVDWLPPVRELRLR